MVLAYSIMDSWLVDKSNHEALSVLLFLIKMSIIFHSPPSGPSEATVRRLASTVDSRKEKFYYSRLSSLALFSIFFYLSDKFHETSKHQDEECSLSIVGRK
jgi:hypothetical protein